MQSHILEAQFKNWHDFEIESRKEIVTLLRSIGEKNQLIRMLINGQADVCVTSILDVTASEVFLDCSIDKQQNQRILATKSIEFETTLDKIRIMFSSRQVLETLHDGRPALKILMPMTLIRLQRREYYRMPTPLGLPVMVKIPMPEEMGGGSHLLPLADISCGGIAILDNLRHLQNTIGQNYVECLIDLPHVGIINTTLQIRNSLDLTLLNSKTTRRLGCRFVGISRSMLADVQRYITKLERERNARTAGLA
jgi:c-di-GMP-binding flagellar brake protein YcgR